MNGSVVGLGGPGSAVAVPGSGAGAVGLEAAVEALLDEALALYRDSPRAVSWLRGHRARFAEPVRVAVAGGRGTGKSTLVSALVGEEFAPQPTATAWYRDGARPAAWVGAHEVPVVRRDDGVRVEAGGAERVVVEWPARSLRDLVLVDTRADAPVELVFGEADAVLHLSRHVRDEDLERLRAGHDHPIARAASVTTLLVLARADEIGGGRIDALSSAKQIARRCRRDPAVRGLCQDAVAFAGLLAVASRTLRDEEFAALGALSGVARAELDGHLLSADRFAGEDFPVALGAAARQRLLDRLGLFGVRLCTTLIRQGFDTRVKLTGQLAQRSGLGQLREAIGSHLTERRGALKARSALLGLDVVLRAEPRPGSVGLLGALERVVAGAHDFRELRLLAALGGGRVGLPGELGAEATRLVGGAGTGAAARLGVEEQGLSGRELRHVLLDVLGRWREHAASPVLDNTQRRAAGVVVRSCEGVLVGMGAVG
ncbi:MULTISPECIES: hypothetical protein [Actinosynnema]|uniref:hypothetical protein n=1 Tax=Actinosynnema TaxID=40566 RepID=UPI0035579F99